MPRSDAPPPDGHPPQSSDVETDQDPERPQRLSHVEIELADGRYLLAYHRPEQSPPDA